MYYNRRFTGLITAPILKSQVFVFSSYSNGLNKAGTAKAALTYFGASSGVGEGYCGQSYAIPSEVSLGEMISAVNRFIDFAKNHPELEFLVTPIGLGRIFNRDATEMANLFYDAIPVENIILPKEFIEVLEPHVPDNQYHSIGPKEWIDYKQIKHDDVEFNESAVMKQDDGKYTLLGLANMEMSGSWSGFFYNESMKDFDKVLLSVVTPDLGYSVASEFVQSCVIVKRNGLWGCISTRCEDYSRQVLPIKYHSEKDVMEDLKRVSRMDADFIWRSYEEYIGADEISLKTAEREQKDNRFKVIVGDITKLEVDAIVNAANSTLLGGGGIDGAIHRAAGPKLLDECKRLGGCKVGESKMTDAYNLPCKKIIHTVGPDMRRITDTGEACDYLESCYKTVLDLAVEYNLKSVAFCCISTGIFRFPKPNAARIALHVISVHPYRGNVQICCFTPEDKTYYDIEGWARYSWDNQDY